MKYQHLILLSSLLFLFSCSKNEITLPPYNPDVNLENTLPISDTIMKKMEGIFNLADGNSGLGEQFVCKVSKRSVSFFSDANGIFIILKYGLNPIDSSIQFSGFWRYSENKNQGRIGFSIAKNEGGSDLLLNGIVDNLVINGTYLDINYLTRALTLNFNRHFSAYTKTNDFAIFAHHGIQTTANPPYAENSLDGVLNDEDYGVNGLEFDVRMTKDNVPICIHDPSINIRLTLKGPLSGDFDQYDFSTLSNYVRLIDGQKIPSVEEVLNTFISQTTMKYMWLDIKGNPDVFRYLEPVITNAYAYAATLGRDVVIFADIPSEAVIDEYNKFPSYGATLPVMCELDLQTVIDYNWEYWGPRYSEGLLLDDVNLAHSLGIKVYSWTLNDKTIIRNYLVNGNFDGMISDYPAYIVYDYYTMF